MKAINTAAINFGTCDHRPLIHLGTAKTRIQRDLYINCRASTAEKVIGKKTPRSEQSAIAVHKHPSIGRRLSLGGESGRISKLAAARWLVSTTKASGAVTNASSKKPSCNNVIESVPTGRER